MEKTRRSLLVAAAVVMAMGLGTAQPASARAWDCTQLTGGGGGTWACYDGADLWYVDCGSGACRYEKM